MVVFTFALIVPIGYAIYLSLFRQQLIGGNAFVGLSNYKVALSDPPWQSFSTEIYLMLAVIYIAFCFAMSKYSRGLERELARAHRR